MKDHGMRRRLQGWRGTACLSAGKMPRIIGEGMEEAGESIFLLGFLIYQITCMWETTTFPLPLLLRLAGRGLGLALILAKIFFFSGYSPRRLAGYAVAGCCMAYTLVSARYVNAFVWIVFLAGSHKVSLKKILQIYLVVSAAGMLMAFSASMIGVIENLRYISEERGTRNSFGIGYPTDFAAHIFYMLVIAFYLKGERLRGWHYLGAAAAGALIYHFCNARLDSGCILLTAALFWAGNAIARSRHVSERVRRLWSRCWQGAAPFVMPACLAAALVMTCAYGGMADNPSGILKEINEVAGGRLLLGWQGIEEYGIHLLGSYVKMVGNGGTTRARTNYFFVDSSYINLLLRAGILFTAILLLFYAVSCRRNRHDLHFLYMVALISVNSMVAHHLAEPAYNPLLLAVFTECVRVPDGGPASSKPKRRLSVEAE